VCASHQTDKDMLRSKWAFASAGKPKGMRLGQSSSGGFFAATRWLSCELICALIFAAWVSGGAHAATLEIASKSFAAGGAIPDRFSCRAENRSPELHWSGAPSNARTLAIIVEDPDSPGGTFTHWIVFNLATSINHLDENELQSMPTGVIVATNDFDHQGYDGPCPPPGRVHHYHFKLIALDAPIDLSASARAAEVNAAVAKHAIASGELVGTFQR
jgi:Raf kinase inhibitor-like YbhB/YbcL family protein